MPGRWLSDAFADAMADWRVKPVAADLVAVPAATALGIVRDLRLASAEELERAEIALVDVVGIDPDWCRGPAWVVFVPDVLGFAKGPGAEPGEQPRAPKPAYGPLLIVLDAATGDFRMSRYVGTEAPDPVSGPA